MIHGISEESIRAVQAYHRAAIDRQRLRFESPMADGQEQNTESGPLEPNGGTEWHAAHRKAPRMAPPGP